MRMESQSKGCKQHLDEHSNYLLLSRGSLLNGVCQLQPSPQKKQRKEPQEAARKSTGSQPARAIKRDPRAIKRDPSEPAATDAGAEAAQPAGPHEAPKVEEAPPAILAAQADLVLYEPAMSRHHLEITTTLLEDPALKSQYDRLVECCNLRRTGKSPASGCP